MADYEAEININTGKTSGKGGSGGNGKGAFTGGFLGGFLGNILSSVKQLFDPLNAIATLLVASVFPILKPFLILFLKVGMLLYRWLNSQFAKGGGADGSMLGRLAEGLMGEGDTFTDKLINTLTAGTFVVGLIGALVAGVSFVPALILALIGTASFNFGLWLGDQLAKLVKGEFAWQQWLADKLANTIIGVLDFGAWLGEKIGDFITGTINVAKDVWSFIKTLWVGTINVVLAFLAIPFSV